MEVDDNGPEAVLRRLLHNNKGVLGYVILNKSGIPVEFFGVSQAEATHYAALITSLIDNTRDFLDTCERERVPMIEPDLRTLRLRTNKHEIIVTPDDDFIVIAIQNPNYVEEKVTKIEEDDEDDSD